MSEVPITLTALDKTMELRRISDEISKLKSLKEIAERELKLVVTSADGAEIRLKNLDTQVNELIIKLVKAAEETTEFLSHCQQSIQKSSESFATILELTRLVTEKADKAVADLKVTEDKTTIIHSDIVRQNEDIDRKNKDLSIYHARLKRHFDEHLPGQVIII